MQLVLALAVVLAGAAPQELVQQQEQQQQQEEQQQFEQQQQQQQQAVVEEVVLESVDERPIQILLDERVQPENGVYSFQVETENGIVHSEQGVAGSRGQTNVQGLYR